MKRYTGIKKRIVATVIDYSIVIVYAIVLFGVARVIYALFFDSIPVFSRMEQEALAFFTLVFPTFLYLVISENSKKHGTLGKQKIDIYLGTASGNHPTLLQVIIRNSIKLLPWQVAHTFMFTGIKRNWELPNTMSILAMIVIFGLPIVSILWIWVRKDHRSVHDVIAKTNVFERMNGI